MPSKAALGIARNIVNQILDEAGTDIATRQRINDTCDQFAASLIERHVIQTLKDMAYKWQMHDWAEVLLPAPTEGIVSLAYAQRVTDWFRKQIEKAAKEHEQRT